MRVIGILPSWFWTTLLPSLTVSSGHTKCHYRYTSVSLFVTAEEII
jgi:hypothetical protein